MMIRGRIPGQKDPNDPVTQQAIRMPDMRTRLPVEQTGTEAQYSQWLILDKGTLQNVDLRNPFKPSISINIR